MPEPEGLVAEDPIPLALTSIAERSVGENGVARVEGVVELLIIGGCGREYVAEDEACVALEAHVEVCVGVDEVFWNRHEIVEGGVAVEAWEHVVDLTEGIVALAAWSRVSTLN